ncbi:hypothetical protein PIIN_09246 [Serendipita indica DSM 11827]|uniref:Uncharacterized protein n=1 Tax=Serendipita indica (strain DSM 11827) TaxID=1109443 RepID=G4TVB9_SERID|nr:hypothetical protein PIIN_09246 [Serendipita indica DSM 11827]
MWPEAIDYTQSDVLEINIPRKDGHDIQDARNIPARSGRGSMAAARAGDVLTMLGFGASRRAALTCGQNDP